MLVGVDIDGVLFPWEDAVRDAVSQRYGVDYGAMDTWDAYQERMAPEQWAWLWTRGGTEAVLMQTWRRYPGAIEAVRAIIEAGHSVHFVTHRDPGLAGYWTASYLRRHFHGLRWEGLHVTRPSVAKRTLARWDVFVDDKPETVWDFLESTRAQVFSPRRPWNGDLAEDERCSRLIRYDDPAQVTEWVLARDV